MPFPDGYAGGVYLNYEINGEARWIYLGKICNEKPSSIFKISSLKHEAQAAAIVQPFGAVAPTQGLSAVNIGKYCTHFKTKASFCLTPNMSLT
jgi:hypothetical protein